MMTAIGAEALALLLAAVCPGCDSVGTLLCGECRRMLIADPLEIRTDGGLVVHAALRYEGVVARSIRRVKEDGATMLTRPLGDALAQVLARHAPLDALVVPVPTSRAAFRRRGYRVPELLIRRAGYPAERMLRPSRRTRDQRGLDREERARNVAGSLRAVGAPGEGRQVVIVDDVVTTGSTLDEAARALRTAGFRPVCAVALAATPGHGDTREMPVGG
ncbi:phosphoribosyltransferase family protein [Microbacterium sp. ARD32]|uniref:ComF family protein n=1 Tax=Microbacterium sp. ARD32 TaxID=2962577 RepID=UPI002881AF20|nr:phosphoribosyltransferase family protein [Microbacterium sp. ARD32]MDT0156791.1 phosphoribosyltransferase family protein [Microbacterium sp. ARD32]